MTDEFKLIKARGDAAHAQILLKDEMLQAAFDILDATYMKALRFTMVEETAKRERLWQAIHIVGKVKEHLAVILNGGKLAQAELESIEYLKTK